MDVDSQESEASSVPIKQPRKRRATEMDDENEEGLLDQILPAAAVMKRRKIEEQEEALRNGVSPETSASKILKEVSSEKVKPKKEVNIQEVVRERREAEEDAVRREEDSLKETLDGMNVEDMKKLAVIEEMKLPERPPRIQINGSSSSRWDDAWNGRKNFKKFRRPGDGAPARRGQSVIVPLEEVKKKDFGIGEEYWLENDKAKKKRKGKDRNTQDMHSPPYTTARSQPETTEVSVPAELHVEDDDPDTVDITAPRLTRRAQQASQKEDERPDKSQPRLRVAPNKGKRAASPITSANGPASKRAKMFALPEEDGSESDSEDELKFRFPKKT